MPKMTAEQLEDRPWLSIATSSNVRRASFTEAAMRLTEDVPTGQLLVEWVGGLVSCYEDVPADVVAELERHENDPELSVGRFVHARVRGGGFEHEYVEIQEPGNPAC